MAIAYQISVMAKKCLEVRWQNLGMGNEKGAAWVFSHKMLHNALKLIGAQYTFDVWMKKINKWIV